MRIILTVCIAGFLLFSCKSDTNSDKNEVESPKQNETNEPAFGLVIHGGAGTILKENLSDSLETAYRTKLKEAITVGHTILKNGGTAMEAVTKRLISSKILPYSTQEKEPYLRSRRPTNWMPRLWMALH